MGTAVQTNEFGWRTPRLKATSGKDLILILGPSSAFGWGVEEDETYASQLQQVLAEKYFVVNASEIGYSTEQGRKLLGTPAIANLKPKWILIAYGINDVDRFRFYFQSENDDRKEFSLEKPYLSVAFFRILSLSDLLSLMYKGANFLRSYPIEKDLGNADPKLRVSTSQFKSNLEFFGDYARSVGAHCLFLNTPFNIKLPPDLKAEEKASERELVQNALEAEKNLHYESALEIWQKLAKASPFQSQANYHLASLEARLGHPDAARSAFLEARRLEPLRIRRDVTSYNQILSDLVQSKHWPFVDADRALSASDAETLYVDPVHPSPRGHARLAREIAAVIQDFDLKEKNHE